MSKKQEIPCASVAPSGEASWGPTPKQPNWDPERAYAIYCSYARQLLGQTLTVIDAAIAESRQNKAVKDIIRGHFHEQATFAAQSCGVKLLVADPSELGLDGVE